MDTYEKPPDSEPGPSGTSEFPESRAALLAQLKAVQRRADVLQEVVAAQRDRLRRVEEKHLQLDAVFGAALQSFLLVAPDGTLQAANATFAEVARHLFGRVPSAGDDVEDFVREQDLESFRTNFQRALGGEIVSVTKQFDVGDSPHWFRFVYTPVFEDGTAPSAESSSADSSSADSSSADSSSADSSSADAPPSDDTSAGGPSSERSSTNGSSPDSSSSDASSERSGKVEAVILQSVDVTDQKAAEEALVASEARYRSLVHDALDTSPAGTVILDTDLRVVWLNRAAERFFGIDRTGVIGQDASDVLHQHVASLVVEPEDFASHVQAAYEDATEVIDVVLKIRTPEAVSDLGGDGADSVRYLRHQSRPIRTGLYAGGRVDHYHDVTALKHTEAKLEDARDVAEGAYEDASRFLATVSHEIRTSMTGIQGFADLLMEKDLDAEARYFAKTIHDSGETLLTLLNDVLDLSRLEAGAVQLEDRVFALEDCLAGAVDTVRPPAQKKGLALTLHVGEDLPDRVVGDEMRIRQVLTNLLSNAVKFTEDGFVSLRAECAPTDVLPDVPASDLPFDAPGGVCPIHLSVTDTGSGIPADVQDHLFDAFHQADTSTARKHGGSGLGLAIVRQLVTSMGGDVGVESEPDKGSRFHVYLPVGLPAASGADA